MSLIHALMNSGFVECILEISFCLYSKNYVYYHFIFSKIKKGGGVGIKAEAVGKFFKT